LFPVVTGVFPDVGTLEPEQPPMSRERDEAVSGDRLAAAPEVTAAGDRASAAEGHAADILCRFPGRSLAFGLL
jgi:hypothetical protein